MEGAADSRGKEEGGKKGQEENLNLSLEGEEHSKGASWEAVKDEGEVCGRRRQRGHHRHHQGGE